VMVVTTIDREVLQRSFDVARGARRAQVVFTTRADGDLAVTQPPAQVAAVRSRVVDMPWTWLHQLHGHEVVRVTRPGDRAGDNADASVTTQPGAVLAVQTADCAPLALVSEEGVIAAVHAGWRGLELGVVDAAVGMMRAHGAEDVQAVLGPCVHAECYEFGATDLDRLTASLGPEVRSTTSAGSPALDLPAAVRASLGRAGVERMEQVDACTACDPRFYSHRARGEVERQALVVWLEESEEPESPEEVDHR
jgi:YfiH family protein